MLLYKKGGKLVSKYITPPEHLKGIGCSIGEDTNGYFLYTHRGRSKSRPDFNFTQKEIKWVESTG
jgi:hypothetical protein